MPTVLITGANRGIGLELARQYAADGYEVHACCRAPKEARELEAVPGEVTLHELDVTDHDAIDALAARLDGPLDVVIANAGVYGPDSEGQTFGTLDYEGMRKTLETNTFGALKTCEALLPHVARSDQKKMVAVTSQMGSIGDASAGSTAYRVSKAALNMALAVAAPVARDRGVALGLIHPGWVKTDMGGPNGKVTAEQSAKGIKEQVEKLRPNGKAPFLTYAGGSLPW